MVRKKKLLGRREIENRVEKAGKEMEQKEDILEKDVSDIETIRKTLDGLEGGTSEGFEQVESSIGDAENVTTEAFEREDHDLDRIQEDSQEFGREIQEGQESAESDSAKISDAIAEFKTKEPEKEVLRAKEQVSEDRDVLKEHDEQERRARQKSDAIQEKLKERVHSRKRGR